MKRFKGLFISVGIFVIILAISFYLPEQTNESTDVPVLSETVEPVIDERVEATEPAKSEIKETIAPTPTSVATPKTVDSQGTPVGTEQPAMDEPVETTEPAKNEIKETLNPMPTSVATPKTVDSQGTPVENNTFSCTLTVRCDTILNNIEKLLPEKLQLVPENGIILSESELEFSEGDTVFDVLERELKKQKIHFEFTKVAMSDSVYIEGIGNLYEFDCGNLSGWLYRVNGQVPSVGCSQYKLKNGDKIEWVYTCNLGKDVN